MPIGQVEMLSQSVAPTSRTPSGAACSKRQPAVAQAGSLKQAAGMLVLAKTDPFQTISKAPPGGSRNTGGRAQSAAHAQEPFCWAAQVCWQGASCQRSALPFGSLSVKGSDAQPPWEPRYRGLAVLLRRRTVTLVHVGVWGR